jgi:hypothetical protein
MDVESAHEEWNVYELKDGSRIRLNPVVTEVWRIENA